MLIVPPDRLDCATLEAIAQDFVTRDGTDYGEREVSTRDKVAQILTLIRRGEVLLAYDEETESINLIDKAQYRAHRQQAPMTDTE